MFFPGGNWNKIPTTFIRYGQNDTQQMKQIDNLISYNKCFFLNISLIGVLSIFVTFAPFCNNSVINFEALSY